MIKLLITATVFIILSSKFYFSTKEFEIHNIKLDKTIEISKLFVTEITHTHIDRIGSNGEIVLKTKGNIYYYVDFDKINPNETKQNSITVKVNKLKYDIEIDEKKSGLFFINENSDLNGAQLYTLTMEYTVRVYENLERYAKKDKNINIAKENTEIFIKNYLKQLGYDNIQVEWVNSIPEKLTKSNIPQRKPITP